jgi:hypothetical protein
LRDTGEASEAEPLFRRAIAIGEKTLGLDRPDVAMRYGNPACLLRDARHEAESASLFLRVIAIGEPGHPLTRRYQSHHARLLLDDDTPDGRNGRDGGVSAESLLEAPASARPPQLAPSPLRVSQRAIEVMAMGRSSVMVKQIQAKRLMIG